VLLRLAYLGVTNGFVLLRLLPGGDRDKDIEILSLGHQIAVVLRQLDGQRIRFTPADRAWLAALLHPLPRPTLRRLRLLVRPDTILTWHRDLVARRHAMMSRARPPRPTPHAAVNPRPGTAPGGREHRLGVSEGARPGCRRLLVDWSPRGHEIGND
jgi:hypothetical protein